MKPWPEEQIEPPCATAEVPVLIGCVCPVDDCPVECEVCWPKYEDDDA